MFATIFGGIVAGQAWECEPEVELAKYHREKTGSLFAAATERRRSIADFSKNIVAFYQLTESGVLLIEDAGVSVEVATRASEILQKHLSKAARELASPPSMPWSQTVSSSRAPGPTS